jgi:hypothetical protein
MAATTQTAENKDLVSWENGFLGIKRCDYTFRRLEE